MKKSLLAFAVLSTLAAAASAQTSVTLYGVVDAGVSYYTGQNTDKRTYKVDSGVESASRWGVKGNEVLSNGWNARFNLESYIDLDRGAAGGAKQSLFDRTATVGLSSATYGTIDLGRQTSVEHDAFALVDPANYFFGADNPNRAFGVLTTAATVGTAIYGTTGTDRQNNSIKYTTPNSLGGLSASLMHGAGEVTGNDGTSSYDGLSVTYTDGKLVGVAALSKMKDNLNRNLTLTNIGVKYTIDAVTLKATAARNNTTATKRRLEVAGLGVDYALNPEVTLTGAFYQTKQSDISGKDVKSNQYIAIGTYALSKRTNVYATFDYATNTKNTTNFDLSLGLVGTGNTHGTRTSVGVNHMF